MTMPELQHLDKELDIRNPSYSQFDVLGLCMIGSPLMAHAVPHLGHLLDLLRSQWSPIDELVGLSDKGLAQPPIARHDPSLDQGLSLPEFRHLFKVPAISGQALGHLPFFWPPGLSRTSTR